MIEYKPRASTIILSSVRIILFVLLVFILIGEYDNLLVSMLLILFVYFLFFLGKRLVYLKILPHERNIHLTFKKYFIFKETEIYKVGDLKYSFNYELGPRGIKRKEFKLFTDGTNKLVISIIPNFDGWSENVIDEIVNHVIDLELKEK